MLAADIELTHIPPPSTVARLPEIVVFSIRDSWVGPPVEFTKTYATPPPLPAWLSAIVDSAIFNAPRLVRIPPPLPTTLGADILPVAVLSRILLRRIV